MIFGCNTCRFIYKLTILYYDKITSSFCPNCGNNNVQEFTRNEIPSVIKQEGLFYLVDDTQRMGPYSCNLEARADLWNWFSNVKTSALEEYSKIYEEVMRTRLLRQGAESVEEDSLLDRLDKIWTELTDEERKKVNAKEENNYRNRQYENIENGPGDQDCQRRGTCEVEDSRKGHKLDQEDKQEPNLQR